MVCNKQIARSYRNERSKEKEKKSFRFDDVSILHKISTSHKLQSSKSLTREYETARTTVFRICMLVRTKIVLPFERIRITIFISFKHEIVCYHFYTYIFFSNLFDY